MASTDPGRDFISREQQQGGKAIATTNTEVDDAELVDLGNGVRVPPHQGRVYLPQARQDIYFQKTVGGTLTSVFSTGQKVSVDLKPQGIGRLDKVVLELTLVSTSGNIRIPPAPLLVNFLEVFPNSGSQTLGKQYGKPLYLSLLQLSPHQLDTLASEIGVDGDFLGSKIIGTTATTVQIPFYGSWLQQADIHMSAEFKDTLRVDVTFASNAIEEGTAANLNITDMKLRVMYHAVDMEREKFFRMRATKGLHHMYHDFAEFSTTVTLTAGADNDIGQLSGIIGKMGWFFFAIRGASPSGTSPFRGGLHYYYPWVQFELKESGGKNIIGGSPKTWLMQKNFEWANYFPCGHKFAKGHYLGMVNFAEDPEYSMNTASITGAYRFDGKQKLVITTSGTAVVAAVLAYTIANSGTSAPSVPDGGTWVFEWTDPITKRKSKTAELAFDITPTAFQTAVYALDSFDARGVITLNQTPDGNTSFTLTFGGVYLDYPPTEKNIKITSFLENNTIGHKVVYNSGGSTAGVAGFTTGSYQIYCLGYYNAMFEYRDLGNGLTEAIPHKE